jgi:hypothetical protein
VFHLSKIASHWHREIAVWEGHHDHRRESLIIG